MSNENKGVCGARRATDKPKDVRIRCSPKLFNAIFDTAATAGRNGWPMTTMTRMLIRMGLKEYELNKIAGRKKKDIEADYNRRLAEAQALAAQREARKRSKGKTDTIQAVTPILFGGEDIGE